MSKEEVAEIMTYCKEKGISYKSRLAEFDIPAWKFYDSKSRYAKEQADCKVRSLDFLTLRKSILTLKSSLLVLISRSKKS